MSARNARAGSLRALLGALSLPLVAALVLAPAAGASAHDYLVQSTPAADSVQTTPLAEVSLTFNDRVLDLSGDGSSALAQVVGPDGRHYETGCSSILDRTVSVPVALGGDGRYTVTWQIVSADGHTVSDSLSFTYRPDGSTSAAAGRSARPACGSDPGSSTAAPGASAGSSNDAALFIGIGAGIVVLAIIGSILVIVLGRRSARPARAPADD